jgi:hypothetical protein
LRAGRRDKKSSPGRRRFACNANRFRKVLPRLSFSSLSSLVVTPRVTGVLPEAGVSKEETQNYAEGVRRGDVLVTVRASSDQDATCGHDGIAAARANSRS